MTAVLDYTSAGPFTRIDGVDPLALESRMTDAYDGKTGADYDLLLDDLAEVRAGDDPVAVRALHEHEDLCVPDNLIRF
ncbi:MAG: hypothetical protein OJJ55_26620 [Rhodococcus sp.]|nr:hypothetical protein [Rhodococcus sp. (in: high G+C Gram-positive bacteria)]